MLYNVYFEETRHISTSVVADDPTAAVKLARQELEDGEANPHIDHTFFEFQRLDVLEDDDD